MSSERRKRVAARIEDLRPVVRDHVHRPEFGGGFGLKSVLPALCSGLGYDDLEIQDGDTASTSLDALLRHCVRDTLAMVRLHERLAGMADAAAERDDWSAMRPR